MRNTFVIVLSLCSALFCWSQNKYDSLEYITLEEAKNKSVEEVVALDLSKSKYTELPYELFNYTSLMGLKLTKNKLDSLPEEFKTLNQLRYVYLAKNKFKEFPVVLFQLAQLEVLSLERNKIQNLPKGIVALQEIRYLDLWDNRIKSFPIELVDLPNLEYLDVRGMTFSPTFVKSWNEKLPNTAIQFEKPCACMDD